MKTITFKEMLEEMEGSVTPFSLEWVKYSQTRQTGGEIMKRENLQLRRNEPAKSNQKGKPEGVTAFKRSEIPFNPTFNLFCKDFQENIKVWKRGIRYYNGKKVIY